MDKAALLAKIEVDQSKHISFLQTFLQIPSPNPPGDTRPASKVVIDYLKSHGIEPEIVAPQEHMPNVVHDFEGGQLTSSKPQKVILNGHMDVFPSGPEKDWTPGRGPWSGYIDEKENRIYGRGASDMKCGTAALIIAYTYLHKYRIHLTGNVGLTCTSDEETGGRWGARYLVDRTLDSGFGTRWHGDLMLNAEPSGIKTIRFGEKGTLRLTFTVRTAGAHGAYLHRSASATITASELILSLRDLISSISPPIFPSLKAYMSQPHVIEGVDRAIGAGASSIILKPTLNIGTLNGGLKVNMIPSFCTFEADIRLPIGLSGETVLSLIETQILPQYQSKTPLIETEMQIQTSASGSPGQPSPHDHPIIDLLASNAKHVAGLPDQPLAIPSLGASDCKFWRREGVPTYYYGVDAKGMGQVNESAKLDEFLTVARVLAASVWEYLAGG
ncbi:putative vacuolar carboxypeptidase [Phaeomoniella chlamydospora]|uniref:Putative vacuolar carboxypeptidase n=1 Tax=Phaeomoniella chlamydospora TaxID=158046 RepID=A0A0G2FYG7_PHACM|nr:putative vacuolar carboxypeptidase [Phaeomoniella chlamydospora]